MAVQRGRSKRRGEAYIEYVEPLNEARTKLAVFFNILLIAKSRWQVAYSMWRTEGTRKDPASRPSAIRSSA